MDPHSFWPPARRRRGKEGDQAVLETGDAGGARLRAWGEAGAIYGVLACAPLCDLLFLGKGVPLCLRL